jgi:hypothetical protein
VVGRLLKQLGQSQSRSERSVAEGAIALKTEEAVGEKNVAITGR